jgi:class 3 adenylate cyclase
VTYPQFWRRSAGNFLLGVLISIVPAFAFYSLAFDYTPRQLRLLARLAVPGMATVLAADLLLLAAVLRPLRPGLAADALPGEEQRAIERLLALPGLVLPRIFGLHAIAATLVFNALVVWANRARDLGIPESHFPLYWLLNLTIVPVGHVVYEYHATERLIQQPLARLLSRRPAAMDPRRLVRLPLAARIFLFSALLGLAPPAIAGLIAYQQAQSAGYTLPALFLAQLVGVGVALALLWVLLLAMVSREVGGQTRAITAALDRVASGELDVQAPVQSISEFGRIAVAVNAMAAGLRERQRLRDLFGAYLTRDLAEELLRAEQVGVAQSREVTVVFLDLRDFTALTSRYPPATVVELLNRFFRLAVAAIAEERGHVNKFLGDGVLAVFGAPVALDDAADRALRATLAVRERLAQLNDELDGQGLPRLRMGAAIHTGPAIVGSIGSPEQKLEYTVIGEAVNLTSRIEGLNKRFGTEVLLTRETAERLTGLYPLRPLPPAEVRGIPRPIEVLTVTPAEES